MERSPDIFGYEGHEVLDCFGAKLGRVEKIWADEATKGPQWAWVELDQLHKSTFVPLIGAEPAGDSLRVAFNKETVLHALDSDASQLHLYYGRAEVRPRQRRGPEPLGPPPDFP